MHTLKYLSRPSKLHKVNYKMGEHQEFITTSLDYMQRSDLAQCIIGTQPPYLVARIRKFRTAEQRPQLAERNDKERTEWLLQRVKAEEFAREAAAKGISVQELCGDHYDEEMDEPRLVAKVPGLNVYLELFGTMGPEDTEGEQFWQQQATDSQGNAIRQPYDRMIDAAAAAQLNRMAYHLRATMTRDEQRKCATHLQDWQPRDDWQEEYQYDEYFQRPDTCGIGFDHIDESRRPAQFPRHQLSEQEKQEYQRLKQEAEDRGDVLDRDALARLARQACENVAAWNMIK